MRGLFILICLAALISSYGQYQDDFEDETLGDTPDLFTPSLGGDTGNFILVDEGGDKQLRTNTGQLGSPQGYYLSIPSTQIANSTWEFYINLKFNPSGSNYVDVFLVSDVSDLTAAQNGYFVRIGDTEDWIAFHKVVTGSTSAALINTAEDILDNSSSKPYKIQVTRDNSGNWELFIDEDVTGTYTSVGTVNDTDVTTSANFGFLVQQSAAASPVDGHFFDDFFVGNTPTDTDPPTLQSITAISATEVDVQFNEDVDPTTSQNISNYAIDGGISVTNAVIDADNSLIHLTTDALSNGTTYTITINNVEDVNGNVIATDSQDTFEYLVFEEAVEFDVVINEFLARKGGSTAIPDEEFFELYNRSSKFINLENWTFSDDTSPSGSFPYFALRPGEYVIVTGTGNGTLFNSYGDVIEVPSFRGLNDGGDEIIITNALATDIHQIAYTSATASVTTELINPNGPDYSENNYGLSIDPDGGTPGEQNSIFDDTPDTTSPSIASVTVISNIALDILFDEVLEEASAENIANYSIDGSITVTSATLDVANNLLVHLVVDPLTSGEVRTLSVNGVEDLSGNVAVDSEQFEYLETQEAEVGDVIINEFLSNPVNDSDDFIELLNISDKFIDMAGWNVSDESSTSEDLSSFVLRPGEYLIIYDEDASIDYSSFGNALTIASLTLNNADDQIEITSGTDVQIAFLAYEEQQDDGISLELVNPNDPCLSLNSYLPSVNVSGSTPGGQNSVFDDTPDTEAPTIQSYNFDTSLTLNFSEVMDAASLTSGTYSFSNGLTVDQVNVLGNFPTSVTITLNETIQAGVSYSVTISDVTDCAGNSLTETTINFGIGRSPSFNELIITEIMFDPDPQVELPNQEFIEVYNATSDILSTEGILLTDASATVSLPSLMLNPGEYYILTSTTAAVEFQTNAIGVSSFPSLNNGGEQLLFSLDDNLIFSLKYDPDWHDEDKASGGYSLEMVDITNPCLENNLNWVSSQDSKGGTPGNVNSVSEIIPDNFGPEIVSAIAISANMVQVNFNEKVDPTSTEMAFATLVPAIAIDQIDFEINEPSATFLTLASPLEESILYTLTIDNLRDCSGNEIEQGEVEFALPVQAETEDIKLSEVLFNPRSGGVDFVEVYNNSEKYISLKNWKLGNLNEEGDINDIDVITTNELVINPSDYLVFTTDANILLTNYPKGQSAKFFEVVAMPTYANDEGNVLLIDQTETVVESFSYNEDFHYNLLESVDGVSLERVSFEESTNNSNNWRSASSTEGFATPGYLNSQSFTNTASIGKVTASPEVFIPGNSGSGRDFTTINYQFDQPGQFANVNIYDQTGRLVKNLAQGVLLSTSGFLRWDGDTNDGKVARMGYHLIIFEIYDSSGNSEIIKETVVVGRDF